MSLSPTAETVVAIGVAVASATNELSSLLPFPPVAAATTILLEIFKLIQDLHTQQRDCLRLGERCVALLTDVRDAMTGRGGEPPEQLKKSIAKFTKTLESLRDDMKSDAQAGFVDRVFRRSIMEAKMTQYHSMIDDAARSFQIVSLIHIQRAIGDHSTNGTAHAPPTILSPIYFYEKGQEFFEFSNSSPYSVWHDDKLYPTSAHLFQAHKFLEQAPDTAEVIRTQPTAKAAFEEAARRRHEQRPDWRQMNRKIMDSVLEAKFTQHKELRQKLLDTGDREIIEANPYDSFWGHGADRKGRNELGKSLMTLREKFRAEDSKGHMRRQSTKTGARRAADDSGGLLAPSLRGRGGHNHHRSRSTNR